MTRRPALVAQADIARAARVAASLGPGWRVEIEGPVIRLVQAALSDQLAPGRNSQAGLAREHNWRL